MRYAACWLTILLLSPFLAAQEVGFRNLALIVDAVPESKQTSAEGNREGEPRDEQAICSRSLVISDNNGWVEPRRGEKLVLKIRSVDPLQVRPGDSFWIVAQISNAGKSTIAIPWLTENDTRPNEVSRDADHDIAYINVYLGTGGQKAIGTPIRADTTLFGYRDYQTTYKELRKGEWVTVRIAAQVKCQYETVSALCKPFVADAKARLELRFVQFLSTVHHSDCSVGYGANFKSDIGSKPVRIQVLPNNNMPQTSVRK